MTFTLRDYQHGAKDSTYKAWRDERCVLGVLPTGGGKTVVFADIIKDNLPGRTMVLAHRQELVFQAKDKIEKIAKCRVSVEMGDIKTDENQFEGFAEGMGRSDVVISSIQTQVAGGDGGGRMGKFDPADFTLLIIDEAHHSVAPGFQKVIQYYLSNPKLKVLGVTATPDRADEVALGKIYGAVAFDVEIEDLIKQGWLVPVDGECVEIEDLQFKDIRTTAGDLNLSDLSAVMEAEKPLHGVADETIKRANGKRGLGFCASVEQARLMSNIFNRPGNVARLNGPSAWISAKTDNYERKRIINAFSEGKIQWLWNCGIFTEGYDDNGIEVIAMARPTKSRALYAQMAGRGLRPHESISHQLALLKNPAMRRAMINRSCKPSIHILDFVGNSGKHLLISSVDILSGNYSDETIAETKLAMRQSGKKVRVSLTIDEQEKRLEEKQKKEAEEVARKANIVGSAKSSSRKFDPFDILGVKPMTPRGWDSNKTLSDKQRNVLRKAGFEPDSMEYGRAKQLVGMIIDRWEGKLCSIPQASVLKKHGCPVNVSFGDAKLMLDQIAKNRWRRPAQFEGLSEKFATDYPAYHVNNVVKESASTLIDDDVPF